MLSRIKEDMFIRSKMRFIMQFDKKKTILSIMEKGLIILTEIDVTIANFV